MPSQHDDTQVKNKPFVSSFIVLLLIIGVLWSIPESDSKFSLVKFVRPYISYFGFWQTNTFFAPDVPKSNIDIRATVTCKDGHTFEYQLPRLERMDVWERIISAPYRKFAYDFLKDDYYRDTRIDFAKYVARKAVSSSCAPSVVAIKLFSSAVPEPAIGIGKAVTQHSFSKTLLEYKIEDVDLQ